MTLFQEFAFGAEAYINRVQVKYIEKVEKLKKRECKACKKLLYKAKKNLDKIGFALNI